MIGMKKYVKMSRFVQFKRLRDRPTDQPTDMTSYKSARTHLKMIEKNLGNMRTEEGDKRKRAAQLNTRVCNGNLFSLLPIKKT